MPLRAAFRYCTLRYPLSPLRGQQQIIKNKRWMLSTREWLTFLPTNTTSRKWRATPLRHDATLTKSRSDVSRPTDAFRNILCQVAQPFVSPSLISLRTCLMVADALTKRRTDVSRPTDAFRNICLGGANMYLQHRRCQVARPVSLHHTSIHCAFLAAFFALTRLEGFASPYKHIKDAYIGAERAEMTSYTSEQNLPR